jgi:hypothetical protein
MSVRREVSADQAMEILDRRQQRNYREALEALRRQFAFSIGEMATAVRAQGLMAAEPASLQARFTKLDKIAADALADSGILDATTKEEAGRILDENRRLRLIVHAGILLHEKVRECDDADENEVDEREWYWAARDVLGTRRPPIPKGADSDREVAQGWMTEARTRALFHPEPEKDVASQRDTLRDGLRKIVATDPPCGHPKLDVRTCDLRGIAREALQNAGYTPSGEER